MAHALYAASLTGKHHLAVTGSCLRAGSGLRAILELGPRAVGEPAEPGRSGERPRLGDIASSLLYPTPDEPSSFIVLLAAFGSRSAACSLREANLLIRRTCFSFADRSALACSASDAHLFSACCASARSNQPSCRPRPSNQAQSEHTGAVTCECGKLAWAKLRAACLCNAVAVEESPGVEVRADHMQVRLFARSPYPSLHCQRARQGPCG